jgi:hypothetical protein
MRIRGNKANISLEGKRLVFKLYNEIVKLQAEHTAQQIEVALT